MVDVLERTVAIFKSDPAGFPKPHQTALNKYQIFCANRTAGLYVTFLGLIGEQDLSWCNDAKYTASFMANVPFPGKNNERAVSGGATQSRKMHGIVRYEYKGNIIEECCKDGKQHGLRVVCTQMGHIWIRLFKNGQRLAQIVLNADLSEQSSIDEGGLKSLKQHLHLIRDCFQS